MNDNILIEEWMKNNKVQILPNGPSFDDGITARPKTKDICWDEYYENYAEDESCLDGFCVIDCMAREEAIFKLPQYLQEVGRMMFENYTQEEIAVELGISQPTVCRHFQAIKRLLNDK